MSPLKIATQGDLPKLLAIISWPVARWISRFSGFRFPQKVSTFQPRKMSGCPTADRKTGPFAGLYVSLEGSEA